MSKRKIEEINFIKVFYKDKFKFELNSIHDINESFFDLVIKNLNECVQWNYVDGKEAVLSKSSLDSVLAWRINESKEISFGSLTPNILHNLFEKEYSIELICNHERYILTNIDLDDKNKVLKIPEKIQCKNYGYVTEANKMYLICPMILEEPKSSSNYQTNTLFIKIKSGIFNCKLNWKLKIENQLEKITECELQKEKIIPQMLTVVRNTNDSQPIEAQVYVLTNPIMEKSSKLNIDNPFLFSMDYPKRKSYPIRQIFRYNEDYFSDKKLKIKKKIEILENYKNNPDIEKRKIICNKLNWTNLISEEVLIRKIDEEISEEYSEIELIEKDIKIFSNLFILQYFLIEISLYQVPVSKLLDRGNYPKYVAEKIYQLGIPVNDIDNERSDLDRWQDN